MKKYNVEQFIQKYNGKRHISCGIHYSDGSHECVMNVSCSQIIGYINNKDVVYIVTK